MTKKKILYNPWLIGTGSTILATIGIRLIDYFIGTTISASILNFIKNIFLSIGEFFTMKFEVSLWFLIILPLIGAGLITLIFWIISLLQDNKETGSNQQESFLKYREDVFGEVLYRWEYYKHHSGKYEISNISLYCPRCKCSIVHDRCPVCNVYLGNKIKSDYEIDALIRHKIETQLTTGNEKPNENG